eukprot:c30318_g1_i1 orf=1-192(-)
MRLSETAILHLNLACKFLVPFQVENTLLVSKSSRQCYYVGMNMKSYEWPLASFTLKKDCCRHFP